MIRVLHVAGGVEPELGGPAVAIVNYVRASAAPDVDAHLLVVVDETTSDSSNRIRELLSPYGVTTITVNRTGGFRGRAKNWGISVPLVRQLFRRASEFDLIVVHGAWLFSSVAAVVASRRLRKPRVMIPHESLTAFDIDKPGSNTRVRAKKALEQYYAANCSLFVFASELEKSDSLKRGTTARTVVIRCPLVEEDETRVTERLPTEFGTPLRIGFLGRFHPKKQLDVLIESLTLLPEGITLVVGGDGPYAIRAELRALAVKLGVNDRITWRGFVAAAEKDAFFQSIDVLVMPSEYESFGVVAGEALLRGVPAIVSPRTGIAEVITAHGGGIVTQPVASSLAQVLLDLNANRARISELSEKGPQVAELLTFSRIGALLREEYLRLASGSP